MAQPSFTPLQHGHLLHRAHNFCHHDNRQQRHRWFTFSPLLHHYCVAITFSIFFIISRSHQNQNHLLNHHHHLQVSSFSIIIIISKSHHSQSSSSSPSLIMAVVDSLPALKAISAQDVEWGRKERVDKKKWNKVKESKLRWSGAT